MPAPGPPPGLWPPGGAGATAQPPSGSAPNGQQPATLASGASTSLLTIVRVSPSTHSLHAHTRAGTAQTRLTLWRTQAQIVFLLSTLSEDNFVKNRDEIRSVRSLALLTLPWRAPG